MISNNLDISVNIATYNRAEILRKTLENMTRLDRNGLDVEFVVVDNNSSDHTKEVIESFTDKLPIRYIFEPRPGKNCALNRVLDEIPLGKILLFTDDDVEPQRNWLKMVESTCERWPDYSVFGGKINLILPKEVPYWDFIHQILAFAEHKYADTECPYAPNRYPCGPNFWVRREIFTNGRRFNEAVGPHPTNRIMGSETSLFVQLIAESYGMIYSPYAVVGHLVQPEVLTPSAFRKRAYRLGRSYPHLHGLRRPDLYQKHPRLWLIFPILSLARHALKYILALFSTSRGRKLLQELDVITWIGYNIESIRIACTLNKGEN